MGLPLVSIITPTNDPRYLGRALASVLAQDYSNWEWIVVANGKAADTQFSFLPADGRIRLVRDSERPPMLDGDEPIQELRPALRASHHGGGGEPQRQVVSGENTRIGYWKRTAASKASGEIIVELDHDDELLPYALTSIVRAFAADPEAGMVYSNCASVTEDGSPDQDFAAAYGWMYREREAAGRIVRECLAPEAVPQNMSRIWYAPDHVRAWWAKTYWAIGGHDPEMEVCDDHDLICRMYIRSRIKHIDDLLYLYHVHDGNNVKTKNALIQETTWAVYHRYIERLAVRWARDNGLSAFAMSRDGESRQGYDVPLGDVDCERAPEQLAVDSFVREAANDLLSALRKLPHNSVGILRLDDVLNLAHEPVALMAELHRVLAHGGFLLTSTPSTDGRGGWQDPEAKSFWNQNSFWYWTDPAYQSRLGVRCPWQDLCTNTWFPSDWHRSANIPYVVAHLIAIKDGPRFHGLNHFAERG